MSFDWKQTFGTQPLKGFPSFKGIDFKTGKNVDLAKYFPGPIANAGAQQNVAFNTESAVPGIDPKVQSIADLIKVTSPLRLEEMEAAANISADLSRRQLEQLYPYLSAAGAEATARSLAASQAYRAFTERLPSSVQSIMASKQAQATSAASAEAERQRATAAQQEAASRYGGRFAGQYIQIG
jgi:hypothetical protein